MQRLFKLSFIAAFLALLVILPSLTRAAGEPYRRWRDDGKFFTCTDMGADIWVTLSNQNLEFSNLLPTDEYTINYIENGVLTPDGPYPVEQTSGTKNYNMFTNTFPAYPLTFEFQLDTLRGGEVIYKSIVSVTCTADATIPVMPVNVIPGSAITACAAVVPSGSVQGRLNATTTGLFEPSEDATTNVVLPGGTSWWVIDSEAGFYRLWIACQASPLWVPTSVIGPNYDSGGAALPAGS